MKITKRQLRKIIKEEKSKLLKEGGFKELYTMIVETVLSILKDTSGISEMELVRLVQADYERTGDGRVEREEISTVLDDLQYDGQITFELEGMGEEGKWYLQRSQPPNTAMVGEGTSLDDMPDMWRQILGKCLKENT
jgi:hypothetical protein